MCDVLHEVYREVFNEDFDYGKFDNRKKLEKAVYLIENMGVTVGNYSFSLDKYGPYSLKLDVDAQRTNKGRKANFSEIAHKAFAVVRDILDSKEVYDEIQWLECVTTLHFLKNVYQVSDENLMHEFLTVKPRLDNEYANNLALSNLEKISILW